MLDLQKELQELKAKVAELESRIVAEPVKWQPKGGYLQIDCGGDVVAVNSFSHQKEFGTKRITKEQAKRASIEMRRFNRLLALRDELCGDDVQTFESSNPKCFIVYNGFEDTWEVVSAIYKGVVTPCFKTEKQAKRACDMLNSGEVEL